MAEKNIFLTQLFSDNVLRSDTGLFSDTRLRADSANTLYSLISYNILLDRGYNTSDTNESNRILFNRLYYDYIIDMINIINPVEITPIIDFTMPIKIRRSSIGSNDFIINPNNNVSHKLNSWITSTADDQSIITFFRDIIGIRLYKNSDLTTTSDGDHFDFLTNTWRKRDVVINNNLYKYWEIDFNFHVEIESGENKEWRSAAILKNDSSTLLDLTDNTAVLNNSPIHIKFPSISSEIETYNISFKFIIYDDADTDANFTSLISRGVDLNFLDITIPTNNNTTPISESNISYLYNVENDFIDYTTNTRSFNGTDGYTVNRVLFEGSDLSSINTNTIELKEADLSIKYLNTNHQEDANSRIGIINSNDKIYIPMRVSFENITTPFTSDGIVSKNLNVLSNSDTGNELYPTDRDHVDGTSTIFANNSRIALPVSRTISDSPLYINSDGTEFSHFILEFSIEKTDTWISVREQFTRRNYNSFKNYLQWYIYNNIDTTDVNGLKLGFLFYQGVPYREETDENGVMIKRPYPEFRIVSNLFKFRLNIIFNN